MYEFSHGGLWFQWDALDKAGKRLVVGSSIAAIVAVVPIAPVLGSYAYRLGYQLGSGGIELAGDVSAFGRFELIWLVTFGLISASLWVRFSRTQDELFNRIQNWAFTVGSAATNAFVIGWALLSLTNVLPSIPSLLPLVIFPTALIIFWLVAIRRWA